MSRIAKKPLKIPPGVEFTVSNRAVRIKGKKGAFEYNLDPMVDVVLEGNLVTIKSRKSVSPMVGTTCKLLTNMVKGVHEGFESNLQLVGVGYRAKIQGKILDLSLGFSHEKLFEAPAGITIEVPSNTEIIIRGIDKQLVGETAAKIRAIRPPEIYKGKGVRYKNEQVNLKETKKK